MITYAIFNNIQQYYVAYHWFGMFCHWMQLKQLTATDRIFWIRVRFVSVMDVLQTCCADPGHKKRCLDPTNLQNTCSGAVFRCCAGGICWHCMAISKIELPGNSICDSMRFWKVWQWVTSSLVAGSTKSGLVLVSLMALNRLRTLEGI